MKSDILEKLREAKGEWVSSERLREPAGVSRTAISKHIAGLRKMGYAIASSPRKGYRLESEAPGMEPELIQEGLKGTRFGSAPFVYKETTASTNDDARALAVKGAPEGAVVLAEIQEQGRGRRGRSWFGRADECLQFSVVLRPDLSARDATLIPLLAATAIHRALRNSGVEGAGIKWPNDVLLQGRKVCGVLCEMSVDMEGIQFAIVGMGLNVNTPAEQFPPEIRRIAGSLYTLTGQRWRRDELLLKILWEMDSLLDAMREDNGTTVLDAWREASVTLGQEVVVTLGDGGSLQGVAEDINPHGALLVRDAVGTLHTLYAGEVSLRRRKP